MGKAISQWWQRLRTGGRALRGHQQGQSLVIVTFAFIGILAFVGLAIDLGWVYVERVRVAQAADAAALAGASELPLEEAARVRALVYLQENGYDHTADDTCLIVDDSPISGPPESEAHTVIWMYTEYARDNGRLNTADRILVKVRQRVPMTFMQFIGFKYVTVEATAEAENISNIDAVIVYDKSGSMEFDTLCYGCWEPAEDAQYPNGSIYPLHWSTSTIESADHCANVDTYHPRGGQIYIVIEAEEYSRLNAALDPAGLSPYQTFWVMQRNTYNYDVGQSVGALGRDIRGAYISHHPYADYQYSTGGAGVSCTWADLNSEEKYCRRGLPAGGPFPAPRADYDFYAPRDANYYFHLRGQGGYFGGNQHIFWGVDGDVLGQRSDFNQGPYYDGAAQSQWGWRRLGLGEGGNGGYGVWLGEGNHTLHLWAGGSGFDVDRIIVSTDSSLDTIERNLDPNNGRTGWACEPCDPRFAGRPAGHEPTPDEPYYRPNCPNVDLRRNDIYDDEQPIRDALEAARRFVSRLNPRFDQVGYVRYSNSAVVPDSNPDIQPVVRCELQCMRRLGSDNCTAEVITNTVLYALDRTRAGGSTNIAHGIQLGIGVLSTMPPHYGRPGAAHIMVLMTDGEANEQPNSSCDDEDLWPEGGGAKDCVMYYARQAHDNGIVIYTIGLGESADRELMAAVAELTGGFYRGADNREELDKIFDELFERIFLRLIH